MPRAFLLVGVAAAAMVGCGPSVSHPGSTPNEIRFALLPSDDGHGQSTSYEPLRAGLEKSLNIPVKLVKASDYSTVVEALKTRKAEIAMFGPLSYVFAKQEANAEAFAAGVGISKTGIYHSIITVKSDSPYHSWKDLKGKRIALVDPLSTSGSLMPHYMVLKETGQPLESYFSKVVYCGSHPAAMQTLVNGTVDVAAVEEFLQGIMESKGMIKKGAVRELTRSEDLPPSPIAYRRDMDPTLKEKIKAAFLSIQHLPQGTGTVGVDHFRAVGDSEYRVIEQLVAALKVDREKALAK